LRQNGKLRAIRENARLITRRHPVAFVAVALFGFCFHSAALVLTAIMLAIGNGYELNPIYYSLGFLEFSLFGYVALIIAYAILWFARMPTRTRWLILMALTIITAYDFGHDMSVFYFHRSAISGLLHFFGK
jgi:hypothetical protein